MKILQTVGVALLSSTLIAGGFIWFAKTTRAQELLPSYQYEIAEQSPDFTLMPDQPGLLTIKLKNTGKESWPIQQLSLNSVYFDGTPNRPSSFATNVWIDQTKILVGEIPNRDNIPPHSTVSFSIPIHTVETPAIYQETFKLQVGSDIVTGENIKWLIQVGNTLSYQASVGKQIKLNLTTQRLWAIENGVVIMEAAISSGKPGYNTPKGEYTIFNHKEKAYSATYKLWMGYWMALQNSKTGAVKGYGLHQLPHWIVKPGNRVEGEVKNGRLYSMGRLFEDYTHLGQPMSHGCVRLGLETSRILYNWAPNKTPVSIV